MKQFEYTIKSRTFGLGELPIRRNWKGEKIEQTPRGTNGISVVRPTSLSPDRVRPMRYPMKFGDCTSRRKS